MRLTIKFLLSWFPLLHAMIMNEEGATYCNVVGLLWSSLSLENLHFCLVQLPTGGD